MNTGKIQHAFLCAVLAGGLPLLAGAQSDPAISNAPPLNQQTPALPWDGPFMGAIIHACDGKANGAVCSYHGRRSQLSGFCSFDPPPPPTQWLRSHPQSQQAPQPSAKGGDGAEQLHTLYCRLVPGGSPPKPNL